MYSDSVVYLERFASSSENVILLKSRLMGVMGFVYTTGLKIILNNSGTADSKLEILASQRGHLLLLISFYGNILFLFNADYFAHYASIYRTQLCGSVIII